MSTSYFRSLPTNGGADPFTSRGHAHTHHNLMARGFPEDTHTYAPSNTTYHSKSFDYAHSLKNSGIYVGSAGYQKSETQQDDVPDHGGRKPNGGDKMSPRHRLTQSYHTHYDNYSGQRPPHRHGYTYHPPTTSLASSTHHATSGAQPSTSSRQYRNHGDVQHGYHDERQRGYHDDRRHNDRHLTSSVVCSQSVQPSNDRTYDWLTQSWSQSSSNKPHPQHPHPQNPPESPSEPHPDSSPPATMNRPRFTHPPTHPVTAPTNGIPYIDIISHPEDATISCNGQLVLMCEARLLYCHDCPVYQWYKDEEPLIGEVESVLVKEGVDEEDMGFYFCIVSDVGGSTQRKSRQANVCMEEEGNTNVYSIV